MSSETDTKATGSTEKATAGTEKATGEARPRGVTLKEVEAQLKPLEGQIKELELQNKALELRIKELELQIKEQANNRELARSEAVMRRAPGADAPPTQPAQAQPAKPPPAYRAAKVVRSFQGEGPEGQPLRLRLGDVYSGELGQHLLQRYPQYVEGYPRS